MMLRVLICAGALLAAGMVSEATTASLAVPPPAAIAAPGVPAWPAAVTRTPGRLSEGGIQANDGL